MKNGTSKVSRTNIHLALLLLRKSPQVFGQSFCRVKNIVSPDRYLVLVVGCSCGSLLSLTLFCFQIFCCISCVREIWVGSWGDPCQQWKLKASPSWSPESWDHLEDGSILLRREGVSIGLFRFQYHFVVCWYFRYKTWRPSDSYKCFSQA